MTSRGASATGELVRSTNVAATVDSTGCEANDLASTVALIPHMAMQVLKQDLSADLLGLS